MFLFKRLDERGQGLVEYALILVLIAIVVIAILLQLGPSVGGVFSRIVFVLEAVQGSGAVDDVTAARTGGGNGNDLTVDVTVSSNTDVTVTDLQSGKSQTVSCSGGSCPTVTIEGVGHDAGTVTVSASAGGSKAASYGAK